METILDDIGKHYRDKMVNVAKVDATRFLKAANHFEVRGYPTVKLYVLTLDCFSFFFQIYKSKL